MKPFAEIVEERWNRQAWRVGSDSSASAASAPETSSKKTPLFSRGEKALIVFMLIVIAIMGGQIARYIL